MFTLSAKGIYGLLAMIELAERRHQGSVQIKDIAARHDIPQHYLEQILVILKKAGLVESYRGAQGGYSLAKQPSGIRVGDVLEQLEGRLEVVPEQRRGGALSFFWRSMEAHIGEIIQQTLEDLVLQKQAAAQQFVYSI